MPGCCGIDGGSIFIQTFLPKKVPLSGNRRSKSKKAATFGYLRARVFAQRVRENLWLSATAPFLTAGGGLDRANAHSGSLFRDEHGIRVASRSAAVGVENDMAPVSHR
jgi:hypothetical protein